ncbi:hypothetical protein SDC9_193046 [bioreactor metagenome]|uniref:Uncharacterized protein n=1 Tax=bioreactor metagenome TaxID=1076179 RepID=A0A645I4V4_9ZZZZ
MIRVENVAIHGVAGYKLRNAAGILTGSFLMSCEKPVRRIKRLFPKKFRML